MKSASFNDSCRLCGADIPDDGGCIGDYLCDDCCRLAGHQHQKESTLKSIRSFMTSIGLGFVGSFHRNRAGRIVCGGTAVKSDLPAYVKLATAPPPADAVAISATEMQEAANTIHAQTLGQASTGVRVSAQDSEPIDWTGESK